MAKFSKKSFLAPLLGVVAPTVSLFMLGIGWIGDIQAIQQADATIRLLVEVSKLVPGWVWATTLITSLVSGLYLWSRDAEPGQRALNKLSALNGEMALLRQSILDQKDSIDARLEENKIGAEQAQIELKKWQDVLSDLQSSITRTGIALDHIPDLYGKISKLDQDIDQRSLEWASQLDNDVRKELAIVEQRLMWLITTLQAERTSPLEPPV